ncbi:MAG: efflux RND transporter periplasmic adaptor subunit [gamma proteobacterium symbiont of Bathyaustriella thionipta]|nr:efflux RND transporter periplasmic adaptor subunit [gamma proteobacterium symbiont of Bathyaustriella thionipta]MCU7949266.1 efflux RND transporter periplasmic adaptor subunit [gamma proteobacterium symbiont of Bathyaustriella thionipta]MCU7954406.1 efflux RND transporter periplasmic adaptor subunit [gamma proteobacterium symbiont of Bathyaustriella thionipta]MCU7955873.1 efflux RND transporter periplasmic adaptor subunit [gamma proteobacterium symbiont of Bathyaustriella thionipta]
MLNLNTRTLILSSCLIITGFSQITLANESANGLILNSSQQSAMGMQTHLAKQIDLVPSAIYPAQATIPLQTIRSVSSPLSGQIIKLNYVHGPIQKGQVIAEIESPELLKVQELFLATVSDLTISQQNLNRARQLNKSGVSSTKQLQQALSEVKKLSLKKAQFKKNLLLIGMADSAIKNLETTRQLQPANLNITSPIDGQLFDLGVRLGERVAQNQSIISLGETNPIILVVRVPVETANDMDEGQKVEVLPHSRNGEVKHIDMMVDPMTQSVDIHIKVQNDDNKLRSGQLFKVRFLTETKDTTYQISANAISQYNGKTVVFIKQKVQQNGQEKEAIQALPIQVVNITDKQLYFIPETRQTIPLTIYTKGSTAIKSAMDAANDSASE